MKEYTETVVVGGGQAGLAVSYYLTQHGRSHVVLEKSSQPANACRGYPIQTQGITIFPGLYFVGLPWIHNGRDCALARPAQYASTLLFGASVNALFGGSELRLFPI